MANAFMLSHAFVLAHEKIKRIGGRCGVSYHVKLFTLCLKTFFIMNAVSLNKQFNLCKKKKEKEKTFKILC